MAEPILKKTWEFHHTAVNGSAQLYLWTLKNQLLNMTHAPWTVHASCGYNGSTFDYALGVDYWVDVDDLVGGTGDRSWIVLTNSVTGAQLLIGMGSGSEENCSFYYSPGGLYTSTGFNASTYPTATDYISMGYRYGWGGSDTGWQHVMQSTDGTCLRIFPTRVDRAYNYDGMPHATGWIMFDEVQDAPPLWEVPRAVAAAFGNTYEGSDYLTWGKWGANTAQIKARVNGVHTSLFAGTPIVNSYFYGYQINNETDTDPIERACTGMVLFAVEVGEEGYRGQLTDLWWGQLTGNRGGTVKPYATGTTFGANGDFIQMGEMVFPWDGWALLGD